ncbi:MAG: DUF429 domain-containing protein [Actinobacteria bacterium]|nr:DUF429 domain-containing protein [Actinomycetota bacterium]
MGVVLGADGCRGGGWVVAMLAPALSWHWAADTAALVLLARDCAAVAMDVPIGLPAVGGVRTCDRVAAQRVGARRASVFPAPPREVLQCTDYAAARPIAPSLSAQAFGLVARTREVDEVLRTVSDAHDRFVECHPEVAFAAMAAGQLELASKKSAAGALQRLSLLAECVGEIPPDVPVGAALDDALDAAACAWSAARWARGVAEVLGDELDPTGIPMRIVV